jgi:GT2 family glycosyltransferase
MPPDSGTISLLAVIVIYKMNPQQTASFVSLLRAAHQARGRHIRLRILLVDNSPEARIAEELPDGVDYVAFPVNGGVSDACNYAIEIAKSGGFDWLLTLDQDTQLPEDFLTRLCDVIAAVDADQEIAAVVPQIVERGRILSPEYFLLNAYPRYFRLGFRGVSNKTTFAFNSASTLRVNALREIGGYNPMFWLDYSDAYIYSRLNKGGKKIYVAGNIRVGHEMAMMDVKKRVSVDRYRNIILAGCAFWDLELGTLAGLLYTARLLFRFFKQVKCSENHEMRAITLEMLIRRVTRSRSWRIARWQAETGFRPDRDLLNEKATVPASTPK